jgi:hypothetical protein
VNEFISSSSPLSTKERVREREKVAIVKLRCDISRENVSPIFFPSAHSIQLNSTRESCVFETIVKKCRKWNEERMKTH